MDMDFCFFVSFSDVMNTLDTLFLFITSFNSRFPSYFALLIVGKSKCNTKASATQCNTTEKQVQRNGTQHNAMQYN